MTAKLLFFFVIDASFYRDIGLEKMFGFFPFLVLSPPHSKESSSKLLGAIFISRFALSALGFDLTHHDCPLVSIYLFAFFRISSGFFFRPPFLRYASPFHGGLNLPPPLHPLTHYV